MKIRLENIIFVTIFFLLTLTIIVKTDYISKISEREKRALANFPDVNFFHEKFPSKMDKYINDRVGFKFDALALISKILPLEARINFKSKVLVGKDNWLFLNSYGETSADFQRIDVLSQEDLEKIKNKFMEVNEFAKSQGIKLYIIVPPMKHNVYPEFYVKGIKHKQLPSKYESLREYIKDINIPLVDLMEPLKNAKSENILYYLSDEHWNYYGAYIAYQELINRIKVDFPDIYVLSTSQLVKNYDNFIGSMGSLENLLGGTNIYYPDWHESLSTNDNITGKIISDIELGDTRRHITMVTTNVKGPKAFIIHDSFMGAIYHINKSFSRIVSKWEWGISPMKYKDEILKEKPDIIIWELQERYLKNLASGIYEN